MSVTRGLLAVLLLTSGATASAEAPADPGAELTTLFSPKIYSTQACRGGSDCFMTATSIGNANPAGYTYFAELALPPGNYKITGKLSYWVKSPTTSVPTWGNLECFTGLADGSDGDWSSAGVKGDEYVVAMVAPLKLTARSTTVKIGCKLWGGYMPPDGGAPVPAEVAVWGVRLMAERVGPIVVQ